MSKRLHILQANLKKMPETQMSLLNDEGLKDCGLLLISEPYCCRIDGKPVVVPQTHHYWTAILPSQQRETRWPFRSMTWVHRNIEAKQVPVDHADVTAVLVRLPSRLILVFSVEG